MKVLFLVPPGPTPDRVSGFSFLDEEITGLGSSGVEPFVLTSSDQEDRMLGSVRMVGLGRDDIWRQRIRSLGLLVRHRGTIPGECLRNVTQCLHRARLESAMVDAIRRHGIDLIHSHFGPFVGFGGLLARAETGIPLVATFRGMDLLVDRSIDYGLRREEFYSASVPPLLEGADITTYASDFMRAEGIRLGAQPDNAITIRKGVDLDHFHVAEDRIRERDALGIRNPMILTVAGLIRRKGIDTILRALARLKDTHDFTFVVCGDGAEKPALKRLSRKLGLEDRVQFRGRVPRHEIPRYFAACDIFVLASRMEAAGNVLLETMGAGRPVICTDSGGPPEYVREGRTGHVVPTEDDAALAERLRLLLDDPGLRDRMGRAGRRIAVEEHPYESMIHGFLEAYQLAGTRRKAEGINAA